MSAQTPARAADALFAQIPHAVTPAMLEEYGIETTSEQARLVTREVLSLNLYWIWSALAMAMTERNRDQVFGALQHQIAVEWDTELGLAGQDAAAFLREAEERRAFYQRVIEEGGAPLDVFTQAASLLEWGRAVRSEDRARVLACLIDIIPVQEIGAVAEELQIGES
ncbi:MAG: hypothetical protein ACREI3_10765 [Nitrospirales bacterium]